MIYPAVTSKQGSISLFNNPAIAVKAADIELGQLPQAPWYLIVTTFPSKPKTSRSPQQFANTGLILSSINWLIFFNITLESSLMGAIPFSFGSNCLSKVLRKLINGRCIIPHVTVCDFSIETNLSI